MSTHDLPAVDAESEPMPRETSGAMAISASQEIQRGPAWALARLSDAEFEQVTTMAKKGRERLQTVMRAMMEKGVHYGEIPGTTKAGEAPKMNLLKPGAEVLRAMFRLVADPQTNIIYGDGLQAPRVTVECRTLIHLDTLDGPVVAIGVGACSSWEKKYRYRFSDRVCPACGKPTIKRSSFPDRVTGEKGWYCYAKTGGCGASFGKDDPAIAEQETGQIDNPDQLDALNTIVKMAKKRSVVDATIEATASSDLLTQDMEDVPGGEESAPAAPQAAPRPATPRPAPKPAPASGNPLDMARGRFYKLLDDLGQGSQSPKWVLAKVSEYIQRDVLSILTPTAEEWHVAADKLQAEFGEPIPKATS